ncbi:MULTISPECIES: PLxRFG domain-containing protein [unclassified Mameliella]|uniref:PLxRFG domain-containing protein n=1 Tax=Mameliella sp. LZ-28 TaxID=2484146 RepID=UPI00143F83C2|nr:PLxRFG domain-containing protein [Mameliella sp. LZ-28]MCR9274404.1 PLxRFG domain-containing protein [Paracoccaceae bacterium]
MADRNTFLDSPVDAASRRHERTITGALGSSSPAPSGPATFEDVARQHQVPLNVIRAVADEAQLSSESDKLRFANEFAGRLGPELRGGKKMPDAMRAVFGEDAPVEPVLEKAIRMAKGGVQGSPDAADADGRSPSTPVEQAQPGVLGDLARQGAGGVVKGAASSVEGMGRFFAGRDMDPRIEADLDARWNPETGTFDKRTPEEAAEFQRDLDSSPRPEKDMERNSRLAAKSMTDYGDSIQGGVSDVSKDAIRASTPDGDLFNPSTWTLGEAPSLRGYAMLTADVLGSLAPVVLASAVTKSPMGGAAMGGAQSAGAASAQARQTVMDAPVERLEAESAYYREAVARGASPDEARNLVAGAAERMAALYAAPIGAVGGAATGAIATRGVGALAGKSLPTRVGGGALISGAEEGVQEVAETLAGRLGTEHGSGLDVDLTEGTFGDAVLGMLAGGPIGAMGGLRGERPDEDPAPTAPAAADPAAPETPPMAPDAPPESQQRGPLSRAAAAAGPAPEPMGPALTGAEPGQRVKIDIMDGNPVDAIFQEADEESVLVTIDDEPFRIPRADMEAGDVTITPVDVLREKAGLPAPAVDRTPVPVAPGADRAPGEVPPQAQTGRIPGPQPRPQIEAQPEPEVDAEAPFKLGETEDAPRVVDGETLDPILDLGEFETRPEPEPDIIDPTLDLTPYEIDRYRREAGTRRKPEDVSTVAGMIRAAEEQGYEVTDADVSAMAGIADTARGAEDFSLEIIKGLSGMYRDRPRIEGPKKRDALPAPDGASQDADARTDLPEAAGKPFPKNNAGFWKGGTWGEAIQNAVRGQSLGGMDTTIRKDDSGNLWLYQFEGRGRSDKRKIRRDLWDFALSEMEANGISPLALDARGVKDLADTQASDLDADIDAALDAAIDGQAPETRLGSGRRMIGKNSDGLDLFEDQNGVRSYMDGTVRVSETVRVGTDGSVQRTQGRTPDFELAEGGEVPQNRGVGSTEQGGRLPETSTPITGPGATGYSYKLADALDKRDQRLMAANRDTNAGEVLAELDGLARRAESAVRRAGLDIRDFDEQGRGPDGSFNQMARMAKEAEALARDIIDQARKAKTGDIPYPERDENGDGWVDDGSAMAQALQYLWDSEAQNPPMDGIETPTDGDAPESTDPMPADQVFATPEKTETLARMAEKGPFIEQSEADARVQSWKDAAAEIGRTKDNANKVVISLFDYTGAWSQPWADAGYQVLRVDVKQGNDALVDQAFILERIAEYRDAGMEIVGVLSACPCTTFTGTGARWWADLHDKETPEAVEKVFGRNAVLSGAKSPLEYNIMMFEATKAVVEAANPTRFHVLENPIGRIQKVTSLEKPTMRFHPSNFGDPYTKQTQLFGPMNTDLPLANVDPVEGSKVQSKLRGNDPLGKEARSTTPDGFSYAFFVANDPDAKALVESAPETARETDDPRDQGEDGDPMSRFYEDGKPRNGDLWNPYMLRNTTLDNGYRVEVDRDRGKARVFKPNGDALAEYPAGVSPTVALEAIDRDQGIRDGLQSNGDGALIHYASNAGLTNKGRNDTLSWEERAALIARLRDAGFVSTQSEIIQKPLSKAEFLDALPAAISFDGNGSLTKGDENLIEKWHDWMRENSDYVEIGSWSSKRAGLPEGTDVRFTVSAPRPEGDNATGGGDRVMVEYFVYGDTPRMTTSVPPGAWNGVGTHKGNFRKAVKFLMALSPEKKGGKKPADKPDAPPIEDARKNDKLRQARGAGRKAKKAGEPRTPPSWMDEDLSNEWLVGYGEAIAEGVDAAAADADTSPTEAQAEAGNYKMGHVSWNGLDISIENAKGSERRGKDKDGEEWSVTMPAHYGYIKRTEGADGDHVDVYMGDMPDSDAVLIVNQIDPETGAFDEHKVILGTGSESAARRIYEQGFSDGSGRSRIGSATATTVEGFKAWLAEADLSKPSEPVKVATTDDIDAQIDAALDDAITAQTSDTRNAAEAAKDAADKIGKGADAAMDGLINLFGGKDTLSSGFTFSKETYEAAKPLFKEAISQFAGAGADIVQMANALVKALLGKGMTREGLVEMKPYLHRFIKDVQTGEIDLGAPRNAPDEEFSPAQGHPLTSAGLVPNGDGSVWRARVGDVDYRIVERYQEGSGEKVFRLENGRETISETPDWGSALSALLAAGYKLPSDTPDFVRSIVASDRQTDTYAPFRAAVADHMRDGGAYGDIRSLRKQAAEALGRKIEKDEHKDIEEAAEEAIVGLAREIAQGDGSDADKFDQMVALYERQPLLAQKTSTSVENQAYSTPAPLAFLASRLAGITRDTRVTEPTAGTGMLLIEADPAKVRANEKNPDRVAALRRNLPGAEITQGEATAVDYPTYDVLITNPPFGVVKVDGEAQTWPMNRTRTKEIDLAIAWKALQSMPEDGSAVLIVGSVNPVKYKGDDRAKGYQGNGKRQFYRALYDQFNVVEHFTADGSLYKRQGAAWPVDVIVIRGKGKSDLPLPMAMPPTMFNSWSDLKGKLDDAETLGAAERQPGVGDPDPAKGAGPGNDLSGLQDGPYGQAGSGDPVSGSRGGSDTGGSAVSDPQRSPASGSGNRGGNGASDVPDTGRDAGAGRPGTGRDDRGPDSDRPDAGVSGGDVTRPPKRENTEAETDLQVRYTPRSNARFAVGTLVPVNMQDAVTRALDGIEARYSNRYGSIDEMVADQLGYMLDELLGTETTKGYFSAEQVDALAMAIDNVERGKGFIIGDQTGVGKGRFVAAMLRFAERQGRVPIFLTKSPGLYGDMIRDLRDIGEKDVHKHILMTNTGLRGDKAVPLNPADQSDRLASETPRAVAKAFDHIRRTGTLPSGKRMLFTTYSQVQTTAGKEPERRDVLRRLAPNAMFVLDESHEAGGGKPEERKKKDAPQNRAEFIRELVQMSNGTVYSSATYAKNPDVMSLYLNTDLSDAVENIETLGEAIRAGGVPLQQVAAATLTEGGQYARRERTWDGVEIGLNPVPVDQALAKNVTSAIASIFEADIAILADIRKEAVKNLKAEGYGQLPDGRAIDIASADQTGFSSILHNVVGQMLLSLKVDAVAERAAEAVERGEKPVIAVVNTNGSLLADIVDDEGLKPGAPVNVPFDVILNRYIDRLRRITVKDPDDNPHHIILSDSALGPTGAATIARLKKIVADTDMSAIDAAPLDRLKDKLRERGINVGEITGRKTTIEKGILTTRDASEAAKKRQMLAFNSGDLDALLINQAGSTGYSLHALGTDPNNDGKPRRMIVLQPDPNIDTFMQMLGRIHRTGQTELPVYDIAVSDLAVEKRVAAVLMKKMASLSANTTASKDSAVSLDVVDLLNEVGDKVVHDYLHDNFEIAVKLDLEPGDEGIAAKMTGRLALMAPEDTQRVYDELESLYNDEIARLDALGENPLEAQVVDWKAKTLSRKVVTPARGTGSSFDVDTVVETLETNRLGKPHAWPKVEELIEEARDHVETAQNRVDDLMPAEEAAMKARLAKLETKLEAAREKKDSAPKAFTKAEAAVDRQKQMIRDANAAARDLKSEIGDFRPGRSFNLAIGSTQVPAVVIGIDASKVTDNPLAKSKYRIKFALADATKEIGFNLSMIGSGDTQIAASAISQDEAKSAFINGGTVSKELREVVTGNLVNAFAKFGKGQVVQFTMEDGSKRYGVALPKGFKSQDHLENMPVTFDSVAKVMEFFGEAFDGQIHTEGDKLTVSRTSDGRFKMAAKKGAKEFFAGNTIKGITGEWMARGSGPLERVVDRSILERALQHYLDELGTVLMTSTFKEVAREITGQKLPEEVDVSGGAVRSRRRIEDGQPDALTMRGIQRALNAELARLGISGPVSVTAWRKIKDGPLALDGFYGLGSGEIGIAADARDPARSILHHELIHALRDPSLWGGEAGIFTRDEWNALTRAARQDKALMARIRAVYPNAGGAVQAEEAVAEMFRMWVERDDASGVAARAFRRIRDFLSALGNVLRGHGFESAGRVFSKIANGEIGRRTQARDDQGRFTKDPEDDPDGPGGGGVRASRRTSDGWESKITSMWQGEASDAPAVLGRLPAVLRALTGKDNQVVISSRVVKKAGNHGLTLKDVIAAIEGLEDPVMVFDSTNETGNLTALVETPAEDGRPLVIAVDAEFRAGRVEVSRVATIHGKNAPDAIIGWMRGGYLRYINKRKAGEWSRSIGRQLPKDGTTTHRHGQKILQHRDVFKPDDDPDGPGGGGSTSIRSRRRGLDANPLAAAGEVFTSSRNRAQGAKQLISDALTGAMNGAGGANLLALVPGRPLLAELGAKAMPSALKYLRTKEAMDTLRNEKHAELDETAQAWRRLINRNKGANESMMDIMHDATIAQVDPSLPFVEFATARDHRIVESGDTSIGIYDLALERVTRDEERRGEYEKLRKRFSALPEEFRQMYRTVRDEYSKMDDEFQKAIEANVEKALGVSLRRAERAYEAEVERIRDDGLTGTARQDAMDEAQRVLTTARMRGGWSKNARMNDMRKRFESARLGGPYFPLARFGDFFVTARDADTGAVVSFSKFEKVRDQREAAKALEAEGYDVEVGTMQEGNLRDMVDPNFVADIEALLEEIDADEGVMDTIWQRWLETLPDMSVRKSNIHRKGTPGYSRDAFRAFGHHMFHGAHQLARLTYALDMKEHLDVAEEEARRAKDPVRAGLVLKEMNRRHEYVMNPQGKWWSQALTSAAFIYYLGVTPAAAIVNLTQTSVVGTAILGAYAGKNGQAKAATALVKALKDFTRARGQLSKANHLTEDEVRAMNDAYERGVVDKSQAHDLAGVGETGVEYNSGWTKAMAYISAFFHHAERTNREVTFLAAYRLAKDKGLDFNRAVTQAGDLTWKTHFDYQNTSRPRLMQDDYMRVLMTFRNFQLNMLWRLFRDTHQAFKGESEKDRAEARRQLVGITSQMFLHAGIKGVWGYSLTLWLMSMFGGGEEDDLEKGMEKALVGMMGKDVAGMMLNGVPGHLTGIDLTSRIGMPDLWFRSPDRQLEGEDEYNYWVQQFLGAIPGMGQRVHRGVGQAFDGEVYRGIETMVPKAMRDAMRTGRYMSEGAETYNGDPIIEQFKPGELFVQALGFTPARLSERYDANRRLKNEEKRIMDRRRDIQKKAARAVLDGRGLPDEIMSEIREFNRDVPEYAITGDTLERSIRGRAQSSARNEFGVILNQRLDRRLRDDMAPLIYDD